MLFEYTIIFYIPSMRKQVAALQYLLDKNCFLLYAHTFLINFVTTQFTKLYIYYTKNLILPTCKHFMIII